MCAPAHRLIHPLAFTSTRHSPLAERIHTMKSMLMLLALAPTAILALPLADRINLLEQQVKVNELEQRVQALGGAGEDDGFVVNDQEHQVCSLCPLFLYHVATRPAIAFMCCTMAFTSSQACFENAVKSIVYATGPYAMSEMKQALIRCTGCGCYAAVMGPAPPRYTQVNINLAPEVNSNPTKENTYCQC